MKNEAAQNQEKIPEDILKAYYSNRVFEYDSIYEKMEQQEDFSRLKSWLTHEVAGRRVLEVACGTGHWTSIASATAKSILATDISPSLLEAVKKKKLDCPVEFKLIDAFQLAGAVGNFDCGMAHFWLSHIRKSKLKDFVSNLASRLKTGSSLLFIDSKFVEGYRKPFSKTDEEGNTYQIRTLADGSAYEITKNFLSKEEIISALEPVSKTVEVTEHDYLWAAKAVTK